MSAMKHREKRPRMGRPPLPPKDVRSDLIRLRVTRAEKATLTAAAERAEIDVSEWLRSLGLREASKRSIAAEK